MGSDFTSALRPSIVMTILFAILLCGVYPIAVLGIGQAAFPSQANGSLVRDGGKVVGSTVIGQAFTSDSYFQTRPSAAGKGYDGLSSSGSNFGPTSKPLVDRINGDIAKARAAGIRGPIPADLLTASGSGLDPDLSPEATLVQVARVAKARGLPAARVRSLVLGSIEHPLLGFLGEERVNVFLLNRQLDQIGSKSTR
jgi:K+-transporting ATPase ATPase C chain